jgi:alginate O-acetyltransferase complex protein AlgI
MIFNSFAFLLLFLPMTLLVFRLAPGRFRESFLLAASLLFYAISGVEHVVVLALCVVWVWAFTGSQLICGNRLRLTLAIAGPAAALLFYKYAGFIARDVLSLSPELVATLNLTNDKLLPAGISFFTFHLIAFAIDRFRGEIDQPPTASHFGLYIAFFPHLVAGPILRYHDVAKSIENLPRFKVSEADWNRVIGYFCSGLALKVLLADGLSRQIAPLAKAPGGLEPLAALYVLIGYSFQIYFDFWGYSLMAMGLAFAFGFDFPQNFDRPYESLNPRDFWRRWHKTLGTWIRDYLYLPFGGNQHFIRNILIVFALCGLWHGAAWQFVVWGIFHGCLVVFYSITARVWDRAPILFQQFLTFTLVSLGWVLFLFDFKAARAFIGSLSGMSEGAHLLPAPSGEGWGLLLLAAFVCFFIHPERIFAATNRQGWVGYAQATGYAVVFSLAILFLDRSDSFIYFRF